MASFSAELTVAGRTYPVRLATYEFTQATAQRGRVSAKVRHGLLQLTLDVPHDDVLLAWAANWHKPLPGTVVFLATGPQRTVCESVSWEVGHCVGYTEEFVVGDAVAGAYVCHLTISTAGLILHAGQPGTYLAPAAREHGQPTAALVTAVASGVVGAGVPRLPRLTGKPPFIVKGPSKGKPGLDRVEFARQLLGQQQGLNQLTVAEFLANRDRYEARRLLTGDGRAPEGDAAQKLARDIALREKIEELLIADESLTRKQARQQAEAWLETQAALHDPDQVAGGQAHLITGLGDARINSSIGAQWPKRIKGIDEQIRKYAASMSQQERENTYLDVILPLT